jgi:hypothetical protein
MRANLLASLILFGACCVPAAAQVSQQRADAIFSEEQRALADCDTRFIHKKIKTWAEHQACRGNAAVAALKRIDYPFVALYAQMAMEQVATAREIDAGRIGYEEAEARNNSSFARMQTTISQRTTEILDHFRQLKAAADAGNRAQAILAELAAEQRRIELLGLISRMVPLAPDGSTVAATTCQWVGNQFQCVTH